MNRADRPGAAMVAALALSLMSTTPSQADPAGAQIFADSCAACHQAAGQGIKGAFPALAGNAFVQGDPTLPAGVVLGGRGGMPTFAGDLTDEQIAQVLTYVRSSWGNNAGPVTADVVAAQRAKANLPATHSSGQAH